MAFDTLRSRNQGTPGLRVRRALLVLLALTIVPLIAFGTATSAARAADAPDEVYRAFLAANQLGDVDRIAALTTPTVEFTLQYRFEGKVVPMGKWGLAFQQTQAKMATGQGSSVIKSITVAGTIVTAKVEGVSPQFRATGASRVVLTHTLDIRDGKIVTMLTEFDASDAETATYLRAFPAIFPPAQAAPAAPPAQTAPAPPRTGDGVTSSRTRGDWPVAPGLILAFLGVAGTAATLRKRPS